MEKNLEKALVICTPGLEKELRRELREVWPYLLAPNGTPQTENFPEVEMLKGGLEIPCDLFRAVQLNFFLHLATRVLWRVADFKCRDFPKLFQSLKKIPWNQWLSSARVEWHVAAAKSRLNNEKRITEVAEEVLTSLKLPSAGPQQDVYIRFFDDIATVSLDLSGEALYKRVLSKQTGEAPFRETWAHFVLRRMLKDIPLGEVKDISLVDPFCGSGTFLFEALLFNYPNYAREMAFQTLIRAPKLFKSPSFKHNYKWPQRFLFKDHGGSDQDPQMIEVCRNNLETYQNHFGFKEAPIQFKVGEALAGRPAGGPLWLVSNPPWGRRLGQNRDFEELVTGLAQTWRPQKMALVLPSQSLDPACISKDYQLQEQIELKLGGAGVDLLIWNCKV